MAYVVPTPEKPNLNKQDGQNLSGPEVMQMVNAIKNNADLLKALAEFVLTAVDGNGKLLATQLPTIPRANLPLDGVNGDHLLYDETTFITSINTVTEAQRIASVLLNLGYPPITGTVPVASQVTVTGATQEGSIQTGYFTNSDTAGSGMHRWYRATSNSGMGRTLISGATGVTYTLTSADVGKYIQYEVVPVASNGTTVGVAVASAYTGLITAAPAAGGFAALAATGVDMAVASDGTTTRTNGQYNNNAYLRSTMKAGPTTDVIAARFRVTITGSLEEGLIGFNKDVTATGDPGLIDIAWKLNSDKLQVVGEQPTQGASLVPFDSTTPVVPATVTIVEILLMKDGSVLCLRDNVTDYSLPAGSYDPVGAYVHVTAYLGTAKFVRVETMFANPVDINS